MSIDRELIMDTLMARLIRAPAVHLFDADLSDGSLTINVSDKTNLRVGMPVGVIDPTVPNGGGLVPGTVIRTIDPEVTLSIAPTQSLSQVPVVQGFLTSSRAYSDPHGLYPHPSFFLVDYDEDYPSDHGVHARRSNEPSLITLMALGHIHVEVVPNTVPSSVANRLLQALEETLQPDRTSELGMRQTLGLFAVQHACIQGRILKDAHEPDFVVYKVPFVVEVAQGEDVSPDPTDPNYLP